MTYYPRNTEYSEILNFANELLQYPDSLIYLAAFEDAKTKAMSGHYRIVNSKYTRLISGQVYYFAVRNNLLVPTITQHMLNSENGWILGRFYMPSYKALLLVDIIKKIVEREL